MTGAIKNKEHFENSIRTATVMFNATHNQPSPAAMKQSENAYKEFVAKMVMIHSDMSADEINNIVWDRFQILRTKELEDRKNKRIRA